MKTEYTKQEIEELEREYSEMLEESWRKESRSVLYKVKTLKTKSKKLTPIRQLTLNGNFITEYRSLGEATRFTKISEPSLFRACKTKKTAGGFKWIYIN